jgi:hypothetical protein
VAEQTLSCGCRVEIAWEGVPGVGVFTIHWRRCATHRWAEAMEQFCRNVHEEPAGLNGQQRRFLDRLIRRLDGEQW